MLVPKATSRTPVRAKAGTAAKRTHASAKATSFFISTPCPTSWTGWKGPGLIPVMSSGWFPGLRFLFPRAFPWTASTVALAGSSPLTVAGQRRFEPTSQLSRMIRAPENGCAARRRGLRACGPARPCGTCPLRGPARLVLRQASALPAPSYPTSPAASRGLRRGIKYQRGSGDSTFTANPPRKCRHCV